MKATDGFKICMDFCRMCGGPLKQLAASEFDCANGHRQFFSAPAAASLVLLNAKNEVLFSTRAAEPGKGKLGIPGGFCEGFETLERALVREVEEEVGLTPAQYSSPRYILSAIDKYRYGVEVRPTLAVIFAARLRAGAVSREGDDSLRPHFISLADIRAEELYFAATRQAIQLLQRRAALGELLVD